MERPARYKIGQLVCVRGTTDYGKITARNKVAMGDMRIEWQYKIQHTYYCELHLERKLRKLTKKEKGE